ncbi:hypothetical protein D7030_08990 [Flavobacteriaceae bacterium AU392]|nr:hypothetical protein D1817_14995 [Flavobacteriaceae bacterium]RKM84150.1 hypothetical protein D7030_08990 [Flavobacteriaceae bacterium AU392]
MFLYLLKFSFCLAIFLVFYKLFLEKENIHFFKRFYLLAVIVLAFSIPLITFTTYIEPIAFTPVELEFDTPILFNDTTTEALIQPSSSSNSNYWSTILWSLYGLGALVFGVKFIRNLSNIIFKIKRNPKYEASKITNVLLKDDVTPHTFLRYIFFNKHKFETQKIPQEVFWHEETHAKQKHSIDVLIIEFLQVIFWFNPLIYFTKRAIKLNHEFLADQGVLNKGIVPSTYQQIVLAFSSSDTSSELSSAINYSSIKKRFTIMKTKTSKHTFLFRSLILLPLLAITLYSFSNKVIKEKEILKEKVMNASLNVLEAQPKNNQAPERLMQEYREFIIDFQKTNIIKNDKYKRAKVIYYNLMSDTQRASVAELPKRIIDFEGRLAETKEKKPNKEVFNLWKDKKNYALWLDNKVIDNSELNNLSNNDIAYYTDNFVYKNARSNKFPQSHQVHLYTPNGFDKIYKKSTINAYNKLSKTYSEKLSKYLKGNRSDNSELKILYYQGEALYTKISKKDIEKYDIRPLTAVPTQQKSQKKASKKQAAYKVLKTPNKDIVLLDHWYITINGERYYYPYKGDLKKYYDKNGNEVSLDVIKEYKSMYNLLEQLKNKTPHYVYKPKVEQEEMDRIYSDLGGMYFRMLRADKSKVIRPKNPVYPYVRLKKDGKVTYKKRDELTTEDKALLPKLPPPAFYPNNKSKAKGGPNNTYENENYNIVSSTQQATPEQVKEYEKLVNIYSKHIEVDFSIKLKDMSRIKYIYDLMSTSQKKTATPYPQSPPSLSIFITNDGKYLINEKETSLVEIENIIKKFSKNELNKAFVFTGKNDGQRYKDYYKPLRKSTNTKIRSLDETYISIYSDEIKKSKDMLGHNLTKRGYDINGNNKYRVVELAFTNPELTSYTIELAKLLERNGIKNIAY